MAIFELDDRILFDGAAVADVIDVEQMNEDLQTPEEMFDIAFDGEEAAEVESIEASEADVDFDVEDADLSGIDPAISALLDDAVSDSVNEIVFIDSSVKDADSILATLPEDAMVVELGEGEGMFAISAQLSQYKNVDSVHILSQGNSGRITLGNDNITSTNVEDFKDSISSWNNNLSEDADILFYACKTANSDAGKIMLDSIADWSGADVAASTDYTGSNGNWDLEYTNGEINSQIISVEGYDHNLDSVANAEDFYDAIDTFNDAIEPTNVEINLTVDNVFLYSFDPAIITTIEGNEGGTLSIDLNGGSITSIMPGYSMFEVTGSKNFSIAFTDSGSLNTGNNVINAIDTSLATGAVTISIDGDLILQGANTGIAIGESSTFDMADNSTLMLQGTNVELGENLVLGGGTVIYAGTGQTVDTGIVYNDITIATTTTLTGNLDVNGDIEIASDGSLSAGANTINVGQNWSNNGIFTAGDGAVVFDTSDDSVISGTTIFNDFTSFQDGKTLTFDVTGTQTVVGSFTVGTVEGTIVTINSTIEGTQANIDIQGESIVNYVEVEDSYNHGKLILASFSDDGGNNEGWSFGALNDSFVWLGTAVGADTDWENSANWLYGLAAGKGSKDAQIEIFGGGTNPNLEYSISAQNFKMYDGAELTLEAGKTIKITVENEFIGTEIGGGAKSKLTVDSKNTLITGEMTNLDQLSVTATNDIDVDGILNTQGSGSLSITSKDGDIEISGDGATEDDITSVDGKITIKADGNIEIIGGAEIVTSGKGDISLTATNDDITISDNVWIDSQTGKISLTASKGNIELGELVFITAVDDLAGEDNISKGTITIKADQSLELSNGGIIAESGAVSLTATDENIIVGENALVQSLTGNVSLKATKGKIQLGEATDIFAFDNTIEGNESKGTITIDADIVDIQISGEIQSESGAIKITGNNKVGASGITLGSWGVTEPNGVTISSVSGAITLKGTSTDTSDGIAESSSYGIEIGDYVKIETGGNISLTGSGTATSKGYDDTVGDITIDRSSASTGRGIYQLNSETPGEGEHFSLLAGGTVTVTGTGKATSSGKDVSGNATSDGVLLGDDVIITSSADKNVTIKGTSTSSSSSKEFSGAGYSAGVSIGNEGEIGSEGGSISITSSTKATSSGLFGSEEEIGVDIGNDANIYSLDGEGTSKGKITISGDTVSIGEDTDIEGHTTGIITELGAISITAKTGDIAFVNTGDVDHSPLTVGTDTGAIKYSATKGDVSNITAVAQGKGAITITADTITDLGNIQSGADEGATEGGNISIKPKNGEFSIAGDISTVGKGTITLDGENIVFVDGSSVTTDTGAIKITASSNVSIDADPEVIEDIYDTALTLGDVDITSTSGAITIKGTSKAIVSDTISDDYLRSVGIEVVESALIQTAGNISLTGSGTAESKGAGDATAGGVDDWSYGAHEGLQLLSTGGTITVTGTANAKSSGKDVSGEVSSYGVFIENNAVITATDAKNVTIKGTSTASSSSKTESGETGSFGVIFEDDAILGSEEGSISITSSSKATSSDGETPETVVGVAIGDNAYIYSLDGEGTSKGKITISGENVSLGENTVDGPAPTGIITELGAISITASTGDIEFTDSGTIGNSPLTVITDDGNITYKASTDISNASAETVSGDISYTATNGDIVDADVDTDSGKTTLKATKGILEGASVVALGNGAITIDADTITDLGDVQSGADEGATEGGNISIKPKNGEFSIAGDISTVGKGTITLEGENVVLADGASVTTESGAIKITASSKASSVVEDVTDVALTIGTDDGVGVGITSTTGAITLKGTSDASSDGIFTSTSTGISLGNKVSVTTVGNITLEGKATAKSNGNGIATSNGILATDTAIDLSIVSLDDSDIDDVLGGTIKLTSTSKATSRGSVEFVTGIEVGNNALINAAKDISISGETVEFGDMSVVDDVIGIIGYGKVDITAKTGNLEFGNMTAVATEGEVARAAIGAGKNLTLKADKGNITFGDIIATADAGYAEAGIGTDGEGGTISLTAGSTTSIDPLDPDPVYSIDFGEYVETISNDGTAVAGIEARGEKGDIKFTAKNGVINNVTAVVMEKGKDEIITMEDSFHGRTLATLAATGRDKYRKGFEPNVKGFKHVPFNNMEAIKKAVKESNGKTAAILIEPIQGEGGIIPAEYEYMQELRKFCTDNEILLLLDEVQSGIGRSGKFFGHQHCDIIPDVMSMAKALGNGYPIGAFIAKKALGNVLTPGTHASTFGGTPLACRCRYSRN